MSPSEFDRLWEQLSHDQKINHRADVEHLTAKYGDKFGERFDIELRLLRGDQELAAVLQSDPSPRSLPSFNEQDKRLDAEAAGSSTELATRPYLFLGEAVQWILSRGLQISHQAVVDQWDSATRQLFDVLDTNDVAVEGYRAEEWSRIYEPLPSGIWARMNKGSHDDPFFTPIDESEKREDGGTVTVGRLPARRRWHGVRVRTAFVLEHWPSNRAAARTNKGGAPAKADWPALEEAFRRQVHERGLPEQLNEQGWQRQADVERWIANMLITEKTGVSETTLKKYARDFLRRARGP